MQSTPTDRERVRICVKDVEQGVAKVYKISALPFGASGKCGRLPPHISGLSLHWTGMPRILVVKFFR